MVCSMVIYTMEEVMQEEGIMVPGNVQFLKGKSGISS